MRGATVRGAVTPLLAAAVVSVRGGLSARQIAEGSMDHFHCSKNEWSLVVHTPGAESKLVSVPPALLDDLVVYRSWMQSAGQLWKLAAFLISREMWQRCPWSAHWPLRINRWNITGCSA